VEEVVVAVFCRTTSTFDKVEEPELEISKTTLLFVIDVMIGVMALRFTMLSPVSLKVKLNVSLRSPYSRNLE
jgi:hypothetical protein